MLDRRLGLFAMTDRAIAELGSDRDECLETLSNLEDAATQVLAEQGVPLSSVSIPTLTSDDVELSDRASKAMSALISIRLLRAWEQEAADGGQERLDAFYRVANNAMTACVAATLVSPLISDFEAGDIRRAAERMRGGRVRAQPFAMRNEKAKAVFFALWRDGARYSKLADWARAITVQAPELSPPRDRGFGQLERKVSKWGRAAFGAEWPVNLRKSP